MDKDKKYRVVVYETTEQDGQEVEKEHAQFTGSAYLLSVMKRDDLNSGRMSIEDNANKPRSIALLLRGALHGIAEHLDAFTMREFAAAAEQITEQCLFEGFIVAKVIIPTECQTENPLIS